VCGLEEFVEFGAVEAAEPGLVDDVVVVSGVSSSTMSLPMCRGRARRP